MRRTSTSMFYVFTLKIRNICNCKGSTSNTFKNSNVFQLATERKKKDQFDDTLEALKIYVSTKFSEDIVHLDPLFQKLRKPNIKEPIKPESSKVKNEDGTITVVPVDSIDADIYKLN